MFFVCGVFFWAFSFVEWFCLISPLFFTWNKLTILKRQETNKIRKIAEKKSQNNNELKQFSDDQRINEQRSSVFEMRSRHLLWITNVPLDWWVCNAPMERIVTIHKRVYHLHQNTAQCCIRLGSTTFHHSAESSLSITFLWNEIITNFFMQIKK